MALIHGYTPMDFLATYAGPDNPLAVPIAVLIGIPLYSNAAGMIPIMQVLTEKGMAMGTALAFMMGGYRTFPSGDDHSQESFKT